SIIDQLMRFEQPRFGRLPRWNGRGTVGRLAREFPFGEGEAAREIVSQISGEITCALFDDERRAREAEERVDLAMGRVDSPQLRERRAVLAEPPNMRIGRFLYLIERSDAATDAKDRAALRGHQAGQRREHSLA